jgi:HSP20 family protein
MDVYRTKWGWVLRFELAGVRMEDVEVHVMGRQITVSGVRRDVLLEDGCVWYSMEIAYSEFRRTVELPAAIDRGRVQVEGRDGILMVRVITQEEEAR